ncbi:BRI1 kinase inhibitor 1-like [Salvia hispanica]|uniref:BRI1 kinase inhibitor 1-like n=1 Tax=Salvia hispanica TaxID=49212 RepID=UPI002009C798|nr:BRI1 kinase inhibitor 1-like [Salvia hispanica]
MKAQHPNEAQPNVQPKKHHVHLNQTPAPAPAPPSPPHEFSFAISLHPPAAAKPSPPPFAAAIDLSPADDIFFHGHLLPLHLLHHLPVSPRSSTTSLDSFNLPIKELSKNNNNNNEEKSRHVAEGKEGGKSKSFSLLGIHKKEREDDGDCNSNSNNDNRNNQQSTEKKRISRFELIKRYVRFVAAFLSPARRRRRSSGEIFRQQPYSYSGNIRVRKRGSMMRGRRGEFSAPASMRTSPGNSGLLVASGAATPTGKSDSTMEELQAAIQAAIAHCKKSHAVEDKSKMQP